MLRLVLGTTGWLLCPVPEGKCSETPGRAIRTGWSHSWEKCRPVERRCSDAKTHPTRRRSLRESNSVCHRLHIAGSDPASFVCLRVPTNAKEAARVKNSPTLFFKSRCWPCLAKQGQPPCLYGTSGFPPSRHDRRITQIYCIVLTFFSHFAAFACSFVGSLFQQRHVLPYSFVFLRKLCSTPISYTSVYPHPS